MGCTCGVLNYRKILFKEIGDSEKIIFKKDDLYVEMIDCGESDNMIEICGKLDKSYT